MAKSDRYTFQSKMKHMMADLRQKINSGIYAHGEYLPSEMTLIELYSLSKNSVRQALDQLVQEGLIIKVPRVGTQVIASSREKRKIRFGMYPSLYMEAEMDAVLALFGERYPDTSVEIVDLPYEHPESIANLMRLGIVDALSVNMQDMMHFQESGSTGLFRTQQPRASTYSFLHAPFMDDEGQLAVQPFIHSPVVMAYNKEHLREKQQFEPDSSWSWDELQHMLRSLRSPGRYSFALQLYSLNRWPIFLMQQREAGDTGPSWSQACKGLAWLRGLIHEEGMFPLALAQGDFEAEKLFREQKVSVILTTYYMLNQLKDVAFAFDVAPLPHFGNGSTLLLGTGIGVNVLSREQELAQSFADFLVSDEVQEHIRRHSYSLPANRYMTENVDPELAGKPSRLNLHRELAHLYKTCRDVGLSLDEMIALREQLKHYFSYLMDEDELLSVLGSKQA
ncbi:extracellular solute-binding protein [Paenibacillus lemnae]|uniref:Extracellular solute-binding protein n=1 Tax=Paenibacillus lemnae TaxID=1330551 RepID=A0A848M5M1_PAELE|nr:extracellular solute-binding protein [Paenibacillus lemnae]NMO96428.1 extracellular solute-binding protein [Paenibacillus lemnae]